MRKKDNIEFSGEALKELLKRNNKSVAWLAERIGIARESLFRCIKNNSISADLLDRICELFNVSSALLMYGYLKSRSTDIEGNEVVSFEDDWGTRKEEIALKLRNNITEECIKLLTDVEYLYSTDISDTRYCFEALAESDRQRIAETLNVICAFYSVRKEFAEMVVSHLCMICNEICDAVDPATIKFAKKYVNESSRWTSEDYDRETAKWQKELEKKQEVLDNGEHNEKGK